MDVIYSLIPGMIFFGLAFLVVLIWAVRKGQYEDMEGNASRILLDDDEEMMGFQDGGADVDAKLPPSQPFPRREKGFISLSHLARASSSAAARGGDAPCGYRGRD